MVHPWLKQLPSDTAQGITEIQSQCSYHAVSFGERGRIPRPFTTIATAKNGDCKDHSLAIFHYLQHHGLQPYLALVSSGDYVAKNLPSLNQFDHMVVALKDDRDQWQIIDATAKLIPLMERTPQGLIGHHCLILTRGNVAHH